MPVRERSGEPEPKRCKHCHESTHNCESSGGSWRVTLDEDLVQTLTAIYPEWFQQPLQGMAAPTPPPGPPPPPPPPPAPPPPRISPPKAVVDASPLQQAMDKNKESLKVKLMLRRPLNQLVAQGIMPPLKTPPAFHEQRKQLERAKTGDLLKAKIQKRPDRQELERRHILEQQEGHVDPSLAEKQRMLKKARLADQLNDQLSHRPGPLELIQKNILHTDEPIERAVKEGLVPFKATCEGALRRPEHPSSYQNLEDDSPAEESVSPPLQLALSPPTATTLVVTSAPVHYAVLPQPTISLTDLCQNTLLPLAPSPVSITSSTSTLSPLSSAASPPTSITPRPIPSPLHTAPIQQNQRSDAPGKDKNRKKSKSKAAPKARTIKFHEYKGPPNAQKSSSPPGMTGAQGETSYELLLRQQQLFLQWQLEWQHKYPQLILPAPHKHSHMTPSPAPSMAPDSPESSTSSANPNQIPTPPPPSLPPPSRLEDMKVSDLKVELKKRNLPVSGPKPHLIERLRPFLGDSSTNQISDESQDKMSNSVESLNQSINSPATSPESHMEAMDVESQPPTPQPPTPGQNSLNGDDIVREQQRKIEELQRELQKSQQQLQQIKAQAQNARQEPPQDARHNRKLALHHLQAKIQSHQLALHIQQLQALQALQNQSGPTPEKRQQEHREFQRRHSPGPTLSTLPTSVVATATSTPVTVTPVAEPPRYMISPKQVPEQLLQLIQTNGEGLKMQLTLKDGLNGLNGKKNVGLVLNGVKVVPITILPSNPPPQYEEATRTKAPPPPPPLPPPPPPPPATVISAPSPTIKSQTVDDVLEILIKNGELPASAAQIPSQPSQDVINQNAEFISQAGLQPEVLTVSDNQNEMINQVNMHNDTLQELINQNNIQNTLLNENNIHNDFGNHNSHEIINQNGIHQDLIHNNDIHKTLLNQNILLNQHNSLSAHSSPQSHMNENSVLDDLINESSMDSVHHNSIPNSLLKHTNFEHLPELSEDSHMSHMKDDSLSNHDNLFKDEDMSHDQHHHITGFDAITPKSIHFDENDSNLFKTNILSNDHMNHCIIEQNNRDHNRIDDGFNCIVEELLGDDAQDGLDLKELGLDLEGLDSMDFGQGDCSVQTSTGGGNGNSEAMDMDEWLDSLWEPVTPQCDPLLGGPPRTPRNAPPSRPPPHLSWDKLDFATT